MPLPPIDIQATLKTYLLGSTNNLAANASLSSAIMDASNYTHVRGWIVSDVSGTLAIKHANDGTGSFPFTRNFSLVGGTPLYVEDTVRLKFVQAVFTNDGTVQTSFQIALYLGIQI